MADIEKFPVPHDVPEDQAEQAAIRIAHRYHRTLALSLNGGSNRCLIIEANHKIQHHSRFPILADLKVAFETFSQRRATRKRVSEWAKSVEEEILNQN